MTIMSTTNEIKTKVENFLERGQKLRAIKHLKEQYGFSLDQSTVLVEAIEGKLQVGTGNHSSEDRLAWGDVQEAAVIQLVKEGKHIQAVKFVKDHLGLRLKEARSMVETLKKSLPPEDIRHSGQAGAAFRIVSGVFLVVGLIFVIIAGSIYYDQSRSIANSDRVTGKVIRLTQHRDSRGTAPVIEYEWSGRKWLHASKTFSSPPAYFVGEEVPLYINREDPANITVDTFIDRWILVLIFGALGFIFLLIPALILYFTRGR